MSLVLCSSSTDLREQHLHGLPPLRFAERLPGLTQLVLAVLGFPVFQLRPGTLNHAPELAFAPLPPGYLLRSSAHSSLNACARTGRTAQVFAIQRGTQRVFLVYWVRTKGVMQQQRFLEKGS